MHDESIQTPAAPRRRQTLGIITQHFCPTHLRRKSCKSPWRKKYECISLPIQLP
jgi:hypothetical protein